MNESLKVDAFGTKILVERLSGRWVVFYIGNEGKKRQAIDITIPSELTHDDIPRYLEDLLHEWARPDNSRVTVIS